MNKRAQSAITSAACWSGMFAIVAVRAAWQWHAMAGMLVVAVCGIVLAEIFYPWGDR